MLIETSGERYGGRETLRSCWKGRTRAASISGWKNIKIAVKYQSAGGKILISEVIVKISGVTEGEEARISGEHLLEGTERIREPVIEQLVREGVLTARGDSSHGRQASSPV